MLTLGSGTILARKWYPGSTLQPPTGVSASGTGTGSSLAAGTYYVRVASANNYANGVSTPSAEISVTISTGQNIQVDWTAPSTGATPTKYFVFVGTSAGNATKQAEVNHPTATYTRSASLTDGTPASWYGMQTVGEIGGDVEFAMDYQEKEFIGQNNFPMAKAFYGGKANLMARRVELAPENLRRLLASTSSYTGTWGTNAVETHSVPTDIQTQFLYVEFSHLRSDDPAKTVTIAAYKACVSKLTMPFTREDIAVMDLEFYLSYDSGSAAIVQVSAD
jgi:hypothetical protein